MDTQQELISIISPVHNSARFIRETIESVQAQTYKQWEMLIVDDGSLDDTCKIIEQYASSDARIHLIQLSHNTVPANARNVAIANAKGSYMAFLDADDLWLPLKLERQVVFMQKRNIEFSYTLYRHMSESGARVGKILSLPDHFDYHGLLKHHGIGCLTVMLNSSKIDLIQMPNIRHEDYILWLSILKQGFQAYCLQEDLARYRIVSNSVSGKKLEAASWVWQIYRNVEKLSIPYACWCFANYAWRSYKKHKSL